MILATRWFSAEAQLKHHSAAFGIVIDWKAMFEPDCCRSVFISLDFGPFVFSLQVMPWGCEKGICDL